MGTRRLTVPILILTLVAATSVAHARDIGDFIKANGVAAGFKKYGSKYNQIIDAWMRRRGVPTQEATKVVPLVHIDIGQFMDAKRATIGAVQVAGPADAVNEVQAVAIYEQFFYQGDPTYRVLVPVDSLEPWKKLRRVVGVGVSAIIFVNVKDCNAWPDPPPDGCR